MIAARKAPNSPKFVSLLAEVFSSLYLGFQMLTEPDNVTTVRLILLQPSSEWLNFSIEEINIYPCAKEVRMYNILSIYRLSITFNQLTLNCLCVLIPCWKAQKSILYDICIYIYIYIYIDRRAFMSLISVSIARCSCLILFLVCLLFVFIILMYLFNVGECTLIMHTINAKCDTFSQGGSFFICSLKPNIFCLFGGF